MLKLENSIRGLSFSRVAFDLTIQDIKNFASISFGGIELKSLDKSDIILLNLEIYYFRNGGIEWLN